MTRTRRDETPDDLGPNPLGRPLLPGLWYFPTLAGLVNGLCLLAWLALVVVFLGQALFQSLTWPRFFLLLGGAALAGACRALSYLFVEAHIDACQEGLIVRPHVGPARLLRYDDVVEIATGPPGMLATGAGDALQGASLVTKDGPPLALGSLDEQSLEALKPVVLERVARRIGERMLDRLRAGQNVILGEVVLSPRGVEDGEDRLGWQEIAYGTFRLGGLRLVPKDGRATPLVLPFGTPNLHPLLHVLREMQQAGRETEAPGPAGGADRADVYAFLPEAQRPRPRPEPPARRKPPRVPGYPEEDPQLGDLQLGSPKKTALLLVLGLALVVADVVAPLLILLNVFPPWVWIPVVVVSIILALNLIDPSKRGLAVYEKGIVQGGKRLPWKEVVRLYLDAKDIYLAGSSHLLTRQNRLQIDGYRAFLFLELLGADGRELLVRALEATLPRLVRRHHDALVLWGGSLTVKGLTLTRDALIWNDQEYPLARVRKPKLSAGRFTCEARGEATEAVELSASEWNFPVFYSLFELLWAEARHKGGGEE
jgi:hypothetical protein